MNIKSLFRRRRLHQPDEFPGMTSRAECEVLRQLAKTVCDGVIVEIGSYQGRATIALAQGSMQGGRVDVFAVDPHEHFVGVYGGIFGPRDRQAFYNHIVKSGVGEVVRLVSLPSQVAAKAFHKRVGLLWIDGDHSLAGVTGDFESWERHFTEAAILAFDDATDPAVGPYHLIQKLTQGGAWVESGGCGKVRVLKRCA